MLCREGCVMMQVQSTHMVRLSLNMRLMGSLRRISTAHGSTSTSQDEEELLRKLQPSLAFKLPVCWGLWPYSLCGCVG